MAGGDPELALAARGRDLVNIVSIDEAVGGDYLKPYLAFHLLLGPAQLGGPLLGLLYSAAHIESLLGHRVVGAVTDGLEALYRVLYLDVPARPAGEDLGDVEGLGEEPLELPRAGDGQLVVLRELLHAQYGYDVLKLLVPLQYHLH